MKRCNIETVYRMRDPMFNVLYKKSLRFLGLRLRSIKEMRQKIQEWLYKDEMLLERKILVEEQVIEQLVEDRFLDDQRFAEEWVLSRMRSNPRGEIVLRMELAQKGIDRNLIDDVMQKIKDDSELDPEIDQMRIGALKLGEKYAKRLSQEEDRMFVLKLSQSLSRKGFSGSLVKNIVDELLSKRYNAM